MGIKIFESKEASEAYARAIDAFVDAAREQEHKCSNGAPDMTYNDPHVSAAACGGLNENKETRVGSTTDTSD